MPRPFPPSAASPRPTSGRGAALCFGAWLAATGLTGAWMLAGDATPSGTMPPPAVMREARTAWYVLGSDCGLSAAAAARLARHAPRPDLHEEVWLPTGDADATRCLRGAGFRVGRSGDSRLAALPGRRPGPWLGLLDRDSRVIFSGPFPAAWDQADVRPELPRFPGAPAPGHPSGSP